MAYSTHWMRKLAMEAGFHIEVCGHGAVPHVHLILPQFFYPFAPAWGKGWVMRQAGLLVAHDVMPASMMSVVDQMLEYRYLGVDLPFASSFDVDRSWADLYHSCQPSRIVGEDGQPLLCRFLRWPTSQGDKNSRHFLATPLDTRGHPFAPISRPDFLLGRYR